MYLGAGWRFERRSLEEPDEARGEARASAQRRRSETNTLYQMSAPSLVGNVRVHVRAGHVDVWCLWSAVRCAAKGVVVVGVRRPNE